MKSYISRLTAVSAALLILGGCLSACSTTAPPPDQTVPSSSAEEAVVVFRDGLGREVRLPKHPQRVAALLGSFADVWMLAGGTLCAAPDDAREDFGLEMPEAIHIGGAHSPSAERLLSAAPDLVLASASTASHVALLEILESAGITVAYFNVDNFEDYLSMLELCTRLTEREDLYRQNGLAVKAQIEEVKGDYASAEIPDTHRRVLLLRASSGGVKAKGSEGTVLGEMLADMGCINIADGIEGSSLLEDLSVEAVICAEPRHIFVVTMGSDTEAATASLRRMMEENPAWGTLEALREGRLHIMDKTLFNQKPNDRWGEAYRKLYETLIQE